jgi:hypothetical protein
VKAASCRGANCFSFFIPGMTHIGGIPETGSRWPRSAGSGVDAGGLLPGLPPFNLDPAAASKPAVVPPAPVWVRTFVHVYLLTAPVRGKLSVLRSDRVSCWRQESNPPRRNLCERCGNTVSRMDVAA